MKKRLMKMTALLSAVCFLACGCGSQPKEDRVPVLKVNEFGKKDLSETLEYSGSVESSEKDSSVTTELTDCKVKSVKVSVGDRVKKGDVLFELDSTDIERQIADLEKIISDSNALYDFKYDKLQKDLDSANRANALDINEASSNLSKLRNEYNSQSNEASNQNSRYNSLRAEADELRNRIASCEDEAEMTALQMEYSAKMSDASAALSAYEMASSQMKSLSQSISVAEKALSAAKLAASGDTADIQYQIDTYSLTADSSNENTKKLEDLKEKLEKTVIKSAKDGVVSALYAEEGKVCQTGLLMNLQNSDDMCVHVSVPEEDLLSVKNGMKTELTILARKDEKYSGSVDRILEIKTGEGFDCYINIDDTKDFRIGMTARAVITTVDAADILAVTNTSIFEDEETGKKYVFEAEKQGDDNYKIRKVEITEGIVGKTYTGITGEGLEEGDYIVAVPKKCKENDIVNVRTGR